MSGCRHDLSWIYVPDGSNGYVMRCGICGVSMPDGMRQVHQRVYPTSMLIGAGIVLAGAVFLVALVFWWTWLS